MVRAGWSARWSARAGEQRERLHQQTLEIDQAAADLLLKVVCGRREEREWDALDDRQREIATKLIAAGVIDEALDRLITSVDFADAIDSRCLLRFRCW